MASKEKHIAQYKNNKALLASKNLDDYNDWHVTILFYSALHLIESTYADKFHSSSHASRKQFMGNNRAYSSVKLECDNLEMLSRKARYSCIKIGDRQVADAKNNLISIENFSKGR